MSWGWDLEAYNRRSANSRDGTAELMEEAVKDPTWWLKIYVLDVLFSVLREAQRWARGCPCHYDALKVGGVPHALQVFWRKCCSNGMRLAEVVSGDFLEMFRDLCGVCLSKCLLSCGAHIPAEDKKVILCELECGRATLLYSISVKVLPLMQPPYLLCGLVHHLNDRVRRALERCLACRNTHKLIRKLQAEP